MKDMRKIRAPNLMFLLFLLSASSPLQSKSPFPFARIMYRYWRNA
jgi:hypothetical protein